MSEQYFFKGVAIHFDIPEGVNTPIYVIGDSHINVLPQAAPDIFKKSVDITVAVYESKSAYAVGSSGHDYYLNEALQNIPEGSQVLLSFGEIDCRHYVPKMAIDKGTSIEHEVDEVLKRYIPNCVRLLKQRFRVIILGAYVCPQDFTNTNKYADIYEAKRLLDIKFKDYCRTVGILYIPIFETSFINKWHEHEQGTYFNDDSHLGPCMIPVILNSMVNYKWKNFDCTEPTETINFAEKIPVTILKFRRDKHDFEMGWERQYLDELINTLKGGMKVFDIGAENGEFTAMVAKIVGCENVHIFEPSAEYWPNIKRLWDVNGFEGVGGCFDGLVSDNNSNEPFYFGWPETGGEIFYDTHHSVEAGKEISIDSYCELNNIYPDVIMMDVEGSELSIVRGALETMINHSPIFFISVHSDELMARSGGTKEDLFKLFREHGYSMMHINTDHEEHWKFYKE